MKQSIFLSTLLLVIIQGNLFSQTFGGGTGTQVDPYQISTPAHLQYLSTIVMNDATNGAATSDKFFKLMNDIDMTGVTDFIPIGGWSNASTSVGFLRSFAGNFEGNGKKILNLTINKPNNDYVGFFGSTFYATITNLGINGIFTGNFYVGGLIGSQNSGKVSNCYATVSVTGSTYVGGLIGNNYSSNIANSYATGLVTSFSSVGGLIGYISVR